MLAALPQIYTVQANCLREPPEKLWGVLKRAHALKETKTASLLGCVLHLSAVFQSITGLGLAICVSSPQPSPAKVRDDDDDKLLLYINP